MPLTAEQVADRIKAARRIRGIDQHTIGPAMEAQGFGKSDVGRIERGIIPLTAGRRRALAEILQVPERWFTDDDPFARMADDTPQITRLEGRLEEVWSLLVALVGGHAVAQTLPEVMARRREEVAAAFDEALRAGTEVRDGTETRGEAAPPTS